MKKRLQNKNPRVQWFTLTVRLLPCQQNSIPDNSSNRNRVQVVESVVKNCGEYLHTQVVESSILLEMVKIGKKKVTPHSSNRVPDSGCLTAVLCLPLTGWGPASPGPLPGAVGHVA